MSMVSSTRFLVSLIKFAALFVNGSMAEAVSLCSHSLRLSNGISLG